MTLTPSDSGSRRPGLVTSVKDWSDRLRRYRLLSRDADGAIGSALNEAAAARLGQPEEPLLTVLLFGPTKSGKSTLINALAGRQIARTHHTAATTSAPTVYAHESVDPQRLFDYGSGLGELGKSRATFQSHDSEDLRHKVIIDAPDIDSAVTAHRALTESLVPAVDVLLYVVTVQKYKDLVGWELIAAQRGRRGVAFVLNKWDTEGGAGRTGEGHRVDDDFRRVLRERAGYENPVLFRTSAGYWESRRTDPAVRADPAPPPEGDQFPELEQWLTRGLSTSQVARIQSRVRAASWGALAGAVAAATPPALAGHPWRTGMTETLQRVKSDGWHAARPALALGARHLTDAWRINTWPRSPGPFGLYLRFVSALRLALGAGRRMSLVPAPLGAGLKAAQWLARRDAPGEQPGGAADAAPAAAGPMPEQLAGILRRHAHELLGEAARAGLPTDWLGDHWREQIDALRPGLDAAAEQAAADQIAGPLYRLRWIAGVTALTALELCSVTFLVFVVYRVGTGFVTGSFVAPGFVGSAVVLAVCLLALGHTLLGCFFPDAEKSVLSRLERYGRRAWEETASDLAGGAAEFLDATGRLHDEGRQLAAAIDEEIARCRELIEQAAAEAPEGPEQADREAGADALFAREPAVEPPAQPVVTGPQTVVTAPPVMAVPPLLPQTPLPEPVGREARGTAVVEVAPAATPPVRRPKFS